MTTTELIEELNKFPRGTMVVLERDSDADEISRELGVTSIELSKSNGDGTFDACLIYPII